MDENRTPNPEQQPNQPQGQDQNPGQQPVQPQHQSYQQPYHQGYTPYYAPQKPANRGKGGGWIGFLRVMAWIMFTLIELATVISGIALMAGARVASSYFGYGYSYTNWGAILGGLGVIIGGTLLAFIMIAGINVSLDMAMNTARTATNTAKLVEKIEEIEKKMK